MCYVAELTLNEPKYIGQHGKKAKTSRQLDENVSIVLIPFQFSLIQLIWILLLPQESNQVHEVSFIIFDTHSIELWIDGCPI